ncbi:MAG: hypothetical protein JSR87_05780 [Proteobacteria bacterium]|nr:hypothetical protein [Pseudomonadota bacterium]MBS0573842.1 hypothetical protein [Pseudomonadota bacterium]
MGWRQILDMILSQVIRRLVNLAVERGIGLAGRLGRRTDAPETEAEPAADPDPARQKAQDEAARQIRETARMLRRGRF